MLGQQSTGGGALDLMLTMGLARLVEDEAAGRRGMRLGLEEAVTGAVDNGVNAGEALAWPDRAGEAEVCGRGDVAGDAVNGHGRHLAGLGAVADEGWKRPAARCRARWTWGILAARRGWTEAFGIRSGGGG